MLTPLDIENREFKRTMGGYNRDDVEDFMGLILNDYEKLYAQNKVLTERNKAVENELEQLKSQTATIQNAFLSAQNTADTIVKNAQEQAAKLVRDAQEQANKIISEANVEIDRLNNCYFESRNKLAEYKECVVNFLNAQLQIAEGLIEDEPAQSEEAGEESVVCGEAEEVASEETENTETDEEDN